MLARFLRLVTHLPDQLPRETQTTFPMSETAAEGRVASRASKAYQVQAQFSEVADQFNVPEQNREAFAFFVAQLEQEEALKTERARAEQELTKERARAELELIRERFQRERDQVKAFYQLRLCEVTQRYCLEKALGEFWACLVAKDFPSDCWDELAEAVENFPRKRPSSPPRNSTLNKALHTATGQEIARKLWGACVPSLPPMYGSLSEGIHYPDTAVVFMQSDAASEYKEFLKVLAQHYSLQFSEVNVIVASTYKESP